MSHKSIIVCRQKNELLVKKKKKSVPLSCEPAAIHFLPACRIPGKGRTTTNTEQPKPVINEVYYPINTFQTTVFQMTNISTFLSSLRADTSSFATLVSVISSAQIYLKKIKTLKGFFWDHMTEDFGLGGVVL